MKKIGIAIDPWKRQTFEEILTEAGYKYEVTPGDPITTITIKIKPPYILEMHKLQKVVTRCQNKAAELKN